MSCSFELISMVKIVYKLVVFFFQDCEAVIEKYKSGFVPPGDVPFDDLSNSKHNGSDGDTNSLPGHNTSNHSTPRYSIYLPRQNTAYSDAFSSISNIVIFTFTTKELKNIYSRHLILRIVKI